MKTRFVLIASLVMFGCGEGAEPTSSNADPSPPPSEAKQRTRPTEVEMVNAMEAHYGPTILAHDAVIHADLDGFRTQLAKVSEQRLPASTPEAWLPLHERLVVAAREGSRAADLDAAALTLAAVALSCGTCHVALGSGPVYPAPAADASANPLEAAMLDHKWASERLWEGVTGPWDNAWVRGADAMAVAKVFGDLAPEVVLTEDLQQRERDLRALGELARNTGALDQRAVLYGRMLATCGDCHRAVGVKPESF